MFGLWPTPAVAGQPIVLGPVTNFQIQSLISVNEVFLLVLISCVLEKELIFVAYSVTSLEEKYCVVVYSGSKCVEFLVNFLLKSFSLVKLVNLRLIRHFYFIHQERYPIKKRLRGFPFQDHVLPWIWIPFLHFPHIFLSKICSIKIILLPG